MARPTTVLYIAHSLDGRIARADGSLDWLLSYQESGEDHGFAEFETSVDCLVMGRRTWDHLQALVAEWPHANKRTVIRSSGRSGTLTPNSEFSCEPASVLLARLEREGVKNIWLVGGAAALEDFFAERRVDRMELFTVPKVLGEGPRLFPEGVASDWDLETIHVSASGIVHSSYRLSPGFPTVAAGV